MQIISKILIISGVFIPVISMAQTLPVHQTGILKFTSPVDIPVILSGNYGEIRSTSFHAGIDIKTQQVEGKNVLAAADGFVVRVAVLTGSYGKAIYLKHPNGMVTLYGHLSRFEPELEAWVKAQQYLNKSYTADLYPEEGKFSYKSGEFIGLSGNTGSSEGPHVHFEIRDGATAVPLNPLNFISFVQDHTSPRISWLAVYPLNESSIVNGKFERAFFQVNQRNGTPTVYPGTVKVNGPFGFGIETYDFLDNSGNECNPYTIGLYIDDNQVYFCRIDSIPFSMMGYVNSYIDYEDKIQSGRKIHKLYIDPNNQLEIYKTSRGSGRIQLNDTLRHLIRIEVSDTYGNSSILRFQAQQTTSFPVKPELKDDPSIVARFDYDRLNEYENDEVRIVIPEGALFKPLSFRYFKTASGRSASVFNIHDEKTPLFKSYILSIKPTGIPESLLSKALIAGPAKNGSQVSFGGIYNDGYVTTQVKQFGQFFIALDTINPVIHTRNANNGGILNEGDLISFTISDSLSGIGKYTGYIDKKWALFEYDPKNNLLFYRVDGSKLERNLNHVIDIIVTDNKENTTTFTGEFKF